MQAVADWISNEFAVHTFRFQMETPDYEACMADVNNFHSTLRERVRQQQPPHQKCSK